MSAHYSGAAGYCRLFMGPYLAALGVPAFMAVESDQLFFDDVGMLWDRFGGSGGGRAEPPPTPRPPPPHTHPAARPPPLTQILTPTPRHGGEPSVSARP